MNALSSIEANKYLANVGMELGSWREIRDIGGKTRNPSRVRKLACRDYDLLNLCHHLVAWLPRGDWKLFQIDHSTGWLDPVQISWIGGLLYGAEDARDLNSYENRGFLFLFDSSAPLAASHKELLVANLLYVFLLFELHAYVVSSGSRDGEMLGVQDGVVYLSSRSGAMADTDALIQKLSQRPSPRPDWILDVIAARQEQTLVTKRSD